MTIPTKNANPTVIGSWLIPFVCALRSHQIDGVEFLQRHGINYPTEANPQTRIPLALMNQLWQSAADITGDELIGLKAGQYVTPTTFSSLSMALLSSTNTKDLLYCCAKYLPVFSSGATITIQETNMHIIVQIELTNGSNIKPTYYAFDAGLSALNTLCQLNPHRSSFLEKAELTRPQPTSDINLADLFGCNISYGHEAVRLYCAKAAVEKTLPDSNAQLAEATEQVCAKELARIQKNDTLALIRLALFEGLSHGDANLESIASDLYMSPRTLHRKLEERETSFRQEIEQVRRELAVKYLKQQDLSLGEISFKLGYSSSSNFSRAFKRWTGGTPQEFRRESLGYN